MIMKKILITENQFKSLIENIINDENEEKYQFDNDWKQSLIDSIKDIKGQAHSILKSVTSTDELDYDNKDRENYIEDLIVIKELVDKTIDELKNISEI